MSNDAASTSQTLAPPGHKLHHATSTTGRPSRAGDSFIYPARRPSSFASPVVSPPLSPRASLNLHEYPPLSPTTTAVDDASGQHKKKKALTLFPSRGLLSSVAGGVCVLSSSHLPSLSAASVSGVVRLARAR
jgi:hypothetical protein